MRTVIDKNEWSVCKICKKTIKTLADEFKIKYQAKSRRNYIEIFRRHIEKDHNIQLHEYFGINKSCNCEYDCGKICRIIDKNGQFAIQDIACGRSKKTIDWANKCRTIRKGKGNPMYGKKPWNLGLTAETSEAMKRSAENNKNKIISKETRLKQSESAKKRKIHGHTGHKHSPDTIEKLRNNTLKMISDGKYLKQKTKPYIEFEKILNNLGVQYITEQTVHYWSVDFYIPDINTYVEIDGDYWHSNPMKYPNGPKSKTQKINYQRDIKKNSYFADNDLKLIRFWEYEIFNKQDEVICKLKKLLK